MCFKISSRLALCVIYPTHKLHYLSSTQHQILGILSHLELIYYLTVNIVNVIKEKNLLDFCANLLENLLESPRKSKSKSAATPDLQAFV